MSSDLLVDLHYYALSEMIRRQELFCRQFGFVLCDRFCVVAGCTGTARSFSQVFQE